MRMLVLGAGLQGAACAFDLLRTPDVSEVVIADLTVDHLPPFLQPRVDNGLVPIRLDVRDRAAVFDVMRGCRAAMSAVPYYFNETLAEIAVEAGVHFCDLGGNTEIVQRQKSLDAAARAKRVSIVPDCGLAPGLINVLAQYGMDQFDRTEAVRIYVGGLPQEPQPPLNYQVVYSLEGVLDYYTTRSWLLRGGQRVQVDALSEIEPLDFPAPVGTLEAFHTAGGLSMMAFRYEGRVPTMEYKTLRYPGHAAMMSVIRSLGFLDSEPVDVKGQLVSPRDVAVAVMKPRLWRPQGRDLVVVRVVVEGERHAARETRAWQAIDYFDDQHGISAMMRTTGYSLAITAVMQVRGQVAAGVHTPDECVPARIYFSELAQRGIAITPAVV